MADGELGPGGFTSSGPLQYIKNMLENNGDNKPEDIKTLVILFAFQVLVPSAIKLIGYAASGIDSYLNGHEETTLALGGAESIAPISTDLTNAQVAETPELVDHIQHDEAAAL